MANLLVTSLPHEGHLNPTFPIARRLQRAGHQVHYLDHPRIHRRIRAEGFATLPYRPLSPADALLFWRIWRLSRAKGVAESRQAVRLFTTRVAALVRHLESLIQAHGIDLLVNDVFNYAGRLAAEPLNIPWVDCWSAGLVHPDSEARPPHISAADLHGVSALFDQRMQHIRHDLLLPALPAGAFTRPSPWLQLYFSCAELEPPHPDPGPSAAYIGPAFDDRQERQTDFPWGWLQQDTALIYVSLGTFFNRRADFYQRVVDAFAGQPVQVIVSTPYAGRSRFKHLPDNIRFLPRVPQTELLSRSDLFITHGGNNSVHEALAAGVPMLVTPVGGEQEFNAHRVRWLGAGLVADQEQCEADELRRLAMQILRDDAFKQKAEEAMQVLSQCNAAETGARLIEGVLAADAPAGEQPVHLKAHLQMPSTRRPHR